ncbi:MAG: metal-dependent transcriptional regulator [archaeon GB-1867-035]|nr:metal-dependent transcriptional regulator [Candidatus Culexmicrobium profundum]
MKITKREAEYLLILFRENAYSNKYISSIVMAKKLNIAPSTVVEKFQRLAEKGYVNYVKRKGVKLTDKGLKFAKKLIRKHRILEVLVVQISGVDANTACNMVKGLEIELNDDLTELLCKSLGRPRRCPHGYEIPEV